MGVGDCDKLGERAPTREARLVLVVAEVLKAFKPRAEVAAGEKFDPSQDNIDARLAVDSGADALIVSNHGGRQLDGAESSINALPRIVAEVGSQIERSDDDDPDAEPVPATVLINPILTPLGAAMEEDWEGCLSIPGLRGVVPRYRELRYQGFDAHGQPIDRTVSGFHARVVQHECDHLWGMLYPMRMKDMSQLGFTDVLFPELALMAAAEPR